MNLYIKLDLFLVKVIVSQILIIIDSE